jgi:hypothetical protein
VEKVLATTFVGGVPFSIHASTIFSNSDGVGQINTSALQA